MTWLVELGYQNRIEFITQKIKSPEIKCNNGIYIHQQTLVTPEIKNGVLLLLFVAQPLLVTTPVLYLKLGQCSLHGV